jgi:cell wall-associated NlpC family hydrolase
MEKLQTGDLILFSGRGFLSSVIRWGTHSDFSHCGLVLRDPTFIHPSLKGLFLWESGYEQTPDVEDNKNKLGVQVTPLHEKLANYKGSVYSCALHHPEKSTAYIDKLLGRIHKEVHNRPYDTNPVDWFEAFIHKDLDPQKTNRFFCSAFVSFVYTECGLLPENTDWSIIEPCHLIDGSLTFVEGCTLDKPKWI